MHHQAQRNLNVLYVEDSNIGASIFTEEMPDGSALGEDGMKSKARTIAVSVYLYSKLRRSLCSIDDQR